MGVSREKKGVRVRIESPMAELKVPVGVSGRAPWKEPAIVASARTNGALSGGIRWDGEEEDGARGGARQTTTCRRKGNSIGGAGPV